MVTLDLTARRIIASNCTVSAMFTQNATSSQAILVTGWNLLGNSVSTPLDVAATLGDATKVTTVWKWIPATSKWAFYAPTMTAPDLATYATNKGYEVLSTVNGGEGFWVNAKVAFTAQLTAGTSISSNTFADPNGLPTGWSLIAVGDNPSPRTFANAIASTQPVSPAVAATSITTLWVWDSGLSSWYFYAPSMDNAGTLASYITNKGYLDFTAKGKTLDPTTGFWVNRP